MRVGGNDFKKDISRDWNAFDTRESAYRFVCKISMCRLCRRGRCIRVCEFASKFFCRRRGEIGDVGRVTSGVCFSSER